MTPEKCNNYWKNEVNMQFDSSNSPLLYINKPDTIIRFLHSFWSQEIKYSDSILELGCNVGTNLSHLRKIGYTNLYGVDINDKAIFIMGKIYPELYNQEKIYVGSMEKVLSKLPEKSIDNMFSVASIEHIHPFIINKVISEIKRICKNYIVTIEYEGSDIADSATERIFSYEYKQMFEDSGCVEIKSEDVHIPDEESVLHVKGNDNKIYAIRNLFRYNDMKARMFRA